MMRKSLSLLFLLLAVSLGAWGQSFTITVGSTSPVAVVTNTYATMVTVVQTSGTSANFIVNANGIPVFLPSGGSFLFVSSQGFGAGTTVGTIQATAGSGVNVLVSQQQLLVPPNAVSQVIFSGTTIPNASASGLCLVSTGTGAGQWAFSSCSGSSTTNFSGLIADAANISGGAFQIGNGTSLAPTGSGTITANLVPTTGLVFPGSSSGHATVVAQAAALTPTLTLPTGSGTFAVSASGLLSLSAATGALTCTNCASTQNPLSQFASTTSAQLFGVLSNPSGTGLAVFNNSPTFITPTLGVATATSINGIGIAGTSGKTLTVNNSLTLNGTDSTTMTFPTTSQTIPGLGQANTWTAGLQTFTAATMSLPASASYAPTTAGLFGYDSTNGRLVFGNGSATGIPIWITGTITSGQCPQFSGITGGTVSAACGSGGGGNVSTGTAPNSPAQYYVSVFSNTTTIGGIATGTSGYPLLSNGASAYPTFAQVSLGTGVTGTLTAAETPAFTGGDIQSAGATLTLTAVSVHGVTYPATPSTNTVPVVTASNTVTYEAVPNAALVNSATTVNSQTCTLGSSCTLPFSVNGTGLSSQAGINNVTSITNAVGLTATPSNPTGNHLTFEITGASYTGNAATASNLSGCTPSAAGDICYYTGSAWTRLAGNSSTALVLQEVSGVPSWVSAGTGNTTSTSLTTNTIPVANGANSIINSLLTDNGTTLAYSGTGGLSLGVTGTAGIAYLHQGTAAPGTATTAIGLAAPTTVTAHDIVFPSAASSGYEKWSTTVNQTGCTASTTNLCGFIESSISLTADVSGSLPFANGGCAGTTQQTCLNNVMPGTPSAGEVAYYNGSNWVGLAGNNSGVGYLSENSSGAPSWNSGISGPISAIVSATGTNTISNGNFAQTWNWSLTGSSVTGLTIGEAAAATGTGDGLLAVTAIAGSTAVPLTLTSSLTGTQTLPTLQVKPTWNTTGVVDAGILENVTNTASGTGSLLIDLQVGGTSQFSVDKAGNASAASSLAVGASSGLAGLDGVGGASSNPSLTGYTTGYQGFMGATSGASPSWFVQLPAAAPAGSVLVAGTPSSNISAGTWQVLYGTEAGIASSSDPGSTVNVPMVSDGSHGMEPSSSGALGTNAFNSIAYLALTGGTLTGALNGTSETLTSTLTLTGDGVHWGSDQFTGNTTAPTITANDFAIGGFSSTSATAYGIQFPNTAPSGGQCPSFPTPTSSWSQASWVSCGGSPGGSNTQIQYNNSSAFGGVSDWTTNGTTTMTAAAAGILDLSAITGTPGLKLPQAVGGTLLAGTSTANLSAPMVIQNTNSSNNNTSITLGITSPGTSTGQTTLNINGAATGGDLLDLGTGGTWASGVLSGQTNVAKVGITGAFTGLSYTSNGTTAGFIDFPQGSTSSAVAPCNTATSWCVQAATAMTAGVETLLGTRAQGVLFGTGSSSAIQDGNSGDANHSAVVSWSTATTIGSTSLCSSANCPAGTYRVSAYIDVTTACTTTGSYVVNLIWTDDTTVSKTSVMPLVGLGVTPTFGPTAITATLVPTSTTDFGTGSFILRSTGTTSINYSTTAGACATGGPGVGKLYFTVEPIQ
jgi:hypothetical protein